MTPEQLDAWRREVGAIRESLGAMPRFDDCDPIDAIVFAAVLRLERLEREFVLAITAAVAAT